MKQTDNHSSDTSMTIGNEKPAKLTDKQKKWIQKVMVDGMSKVDAYMAVYQVKNRDNASTSVYRLMRTPAIITEFSSLSTQLKALEHMPRSMVMSKLKAFITLLEADLESASNRKYYMEALDMVNKMEGNYQHNSTVLKVDAKGSDLSFGGWDPDSVIPSEPIPGFIQVESEEVDQVEPGPEEKDLF